MKIEVPIRYKAAITTIKWAAILTSIIISFFTLQTKIAVLITLCLVIIGLIVEKVIFKYDYLYLNPMPPIRYEPQQTFVAVGFDEFDGIERPFIGLVYRTKIEAQEEFRYFKSINENRYKDKNNELILSYVFDDEKRYTFFVYPNKNRNRTMKNIEEIKLNEGHNQTKKLNFKVFSFIRFFPSTFSGEGNLKEILRENILPKTPFVFQTFYLDNGDIKAAQKKPILKYHLRILDRSELNSQEIESRFEWYDIMPHYHK
ncbi:hypothetical protein [Fictibacillus sp. 26RED30]|uniref:hypothetical protein n=1 Tax=Fictibacillus sp. 26RED30 TaxID=2745877 RepID=UPI0018CE431E|nr:hypothetical protein [Fictibacillus sp. 26RED30]MBH0159640.1 hypothetical protein [Fictibacillus sp. 26RED30]